VRQGSEGGEAEMAHGAEGETVGLRRSMRKRKAESIQDHGVGVNYRKR